MQFLLHILYLLGTDLDIRWQFHYKSMRIPNHQQWWKYNRQFSKTTLWRYLLNLKKIYSKNSHVWTPFKQCLGSEYGSVLTLEEGGSQSESILRPSLIQNTASKHLDAITFNFVHLLCIIQFILFIFVVSLQINFTDLF